VRRALALSLGLLALSPAAAGAQTVVIGANLNRPANAAYGCESLPSTDAFGRRLFLPTGAATCTYLGTGALGNQQEVAQARGPGIVTRVRVKAGPAVGPMQVTILRATRSGVGFACCFHAGQTAAFTPAANGVTTLNVRLPMRSDLNPDFGETVDYLGITVLAPGVAIPAHEIGNPGDVSNPGALGFFPHVGPGQERADGAGIGGVVPLLNADFVPLCSARAARAAQAGGCAPALGLASARVRGRRAVLALECNLAVSCEGRLVLRRRRTGGPALASARVALVAGATGTLRPRLTRAGRRLLRGRRRAAVWATARLVTGSSAVRVTLRR
jgi:hypothetical protein